MRADFIDPIIFSLGPLQVRWYGMMYVIGFIITGLLLNKLRKEGYFQVAKKEVDNLITFAIVGIFLGARLFYVFIYNWEYYSRNLSEIMSVWRGGLSYHGAIFGLLAAIFLFARRNKIPYFQVLDSACLAGAQGVIFGRLGNFINAELYGRVTDVPWGMVFPGGGLQPRHPSQLYQALGEGLLTFLLLWAFKRKMKWHGMLISLYFIFYGIARYVVEFFREPDSQLGYYFGGTTTMGQILCLLMILGGSLLFAYAMKKKVPISNSPIEA
jgi:phosphatidylglycerol:prolipoprotein diacylglycerol transferase